MQEALQTKKLNKHCKVKVFNGYLVNNSIRNVVGHDQVQLVDLVVDLQTDLIRDQVRDEVRRDLDLLAADLDDVGLELPVSLIQDRPHLGLAASQHGVKVLLHSGKIQDCLG